MLHQEFGLEISFK